jgi:hypothetical protein
MKQTLRGGGNILLDRYVYSNIAYQCAKLGDREQAADLREWIFNTEYGDFDLPRPDLNIFLDVPIGFVESKLKSQRGGQDRDYLEGAQDIHEADIQFQIRVRDIYRKQCEIDPKFIRVDCADEAGNMLLCNHHDEYGTTFEIYRTSSVTEAPVLWYTYQNKTSLPMGAKIKVCGDIDKDAAIVVCYEGISGVTSSGSFLQITVKNGKVTDTTVHDILTNSGISWGAAPVNSAGLVPTNPAGDNGWFYAAYVAPYGIQWVRPDYKTGKFLGTNAPENEQYLLNPNALDSKTFNNAHYMALFVSHHFPAWAQIPAMWLYDIGDPSTVSGNYYQESSAIVAYDSWIDFYNKTNHAVETQSSSDVIIAQSKDGLRIFVFCYDHYAGVLCGYSADCVKRPE